MIILVFNKVTIENIEHDLKFNKIKKIAPEYSL